MSTNGLGIVLREVVGGGAEILGAPTPFKRVFTGIAGLDRYLAVLVAFFASLIDDGGAGWEVTAFYIWGMAQFAAGWTLLVLEGRRSGNRGRIVSWIGTAGIAFQNLTWTFIVPLYLTLHVFTSPIAKLSGKDAKSKGDAARQSLFVYLWDLALIPLAVTLGLVVPTIVMSLPALLHQSAATHYNWIAFWQAFPLVRIFISEISCESIITPTNRSLTVDDSCSRRSSQCLLLLIRKPHPARCSGQANYARQRLHGGRIRRVPVRPNNQRRDPPPHLSDLPTPHSAPRDPRLHIPSARSRALSSHLPAHFRASFHFLAACLKPVKLRTGRSRSLSHQFPPVRLVHR